MEQFEKMMELVIKPTGNSPVYNCMLTVNDRKRNLFYSGATGVFKEGGDAISPLCRFRTDSITKPFTAAIILQLAEEGLFSMHDLFFNLVNGDTKKQLHALHLFEGIDCSGEVSVLQLLQHRTGLRDYFGDDERFLAHIIQHQLKSWNWQLVMEKYFEYGLNQKALFKPGEGFYYSDTNYLLLAILIEQVTIQPYHRVLEERIFTPLGLKETFLEFFQTPIQPAPTVFPYYGKYSMENINTSFDWGGGGLVSVMNDLDIFIRSLISGDLYKKDETLKAMMQFEIFDLGSGSSKQAIQYGLGLQKKEMEGHLFFGHSSAYASMVYYDSVKDVSIILSLNQAAAVHKAEWLMNKIAAI